VAARMCRVPSQEEDGGRPVGCRQRVRDEERLSVGEEAAWLRYGGSTAM
jgi:hypothetical protein